MQTAQARIDLLRRQLLELDAILAQAQKNLNTVAAKERVVKWKAKAVPILAAELGPAVAKRLADIVPGLSFTNDLLEELSDEIEMYRGLLLKLIDELKRAPTSEL